MPLPVLSRAQIISEELICGFDTVEVVVGDLLPGAVCEGSDVLSERRLPGNGLDCQNSSNYDASPRNKKACNVQHTVNSSSSMFVTPACTWHHL